MKPMERRDCGRRVRRGGKQTDVQSRFQPQEIHSSGLNNNAFVFVFPSLSNGLIKKIKDLFFCSVIPLAVVRSLTA